MRLGFQNNRKMGKSSNKQKILLYFIVVTTFEEMKGFVSASSLPGQKSGNKAHISTYHWLGLAIKSDFKEYVLIY